MDELWAKIVDNVPMILAAIGIFVAAWIVAIIVSALIKAVLKRTSLDEKVAGFRPAAARRLRSTTGSQGSPSG